MSLRSINAISRSQGAKIFVLHLAYIKEALKVDVKLPLIYYGIQNLARIIDVGYV